MRDLTLLRRSLVLRAALDSLDPRAVSIDRAISATVPTLLAEFDAERQAARRRRQRGIRRG